MASARAHQGLLLLAILLCCVSAATQDAGNGSGHISTTLGATCSYSVGSVSVECNQMTSVMDVDQSMKVGGWRLDLKCILLTEALVMPSQLDTLNITLVQISSSLTSLSLQINTTIATLNQLETTLNGTFGYSASFMGMDVYSLLTRAQNLNATAAANINRASAALTELRALHTTAVQAWQDASKAQADAMEAIVSLGGAVSDSAVTQSTLVGFLAIYDDNRMNLSYVDVVLTNTANEIEGSIAALLAENATLDAIYPAVLNLTDVYLTRYEAVLNLEVAASDLRQAVQEAMSAATMAQEVTQELLVDAQQAITSWNSSLDSAAALLRRLDPAMQTGPSHADSQTG